ncbi:MAG TPA: carboxylesterase family protein, partial [Sphingomonas sp.]|nr:carboxylesterase family protein [Sphingomonas sp.]
MSVADWTRRGAIGAGAAALLTSGLRAAASTAVVTPSGTFTGTIDAGVLACRGIRYGTARRFQAPVAVSRPGETIRAAEFGPACPQGDTRYPDQSEDCLFLNVWTADPRAAAKKPVMLYIHGGAYSNGSVTDPLNDGQALAARGDV